MNLTFILVALCPCHSKNIHQRNELFHVTAEAAKQAQMRHEPAAKAVFIVYHSDAYKGGKGDFN